MTAPEDRLGRIGTGDNTHYLERWCEHCNHTGVVQHPLWALYWQEFTPATEPTPRSEEEVKWWADHGVGLQLDDLDNEPGAVDFPHEEIDCEKCEGRGRTLTYAGRRLLAFMRRWVATP